MADIDELIDLERFIKQGNYPSLVDLIEKTNRSRNTVLKYIRQINEIFESFYPEYEDRKMILNSKAKGKQGYYYDNPAYSILNTIDSEGKSRQKSKRDELVDFLKRKVTGPGIRKLAEKEPATVKSIKNTEVRLDNCETLGEVLFFYKDACLGLKGQEIAKILNENGCLCFEDLKEEVDRFKNYL